MNITIEKPVVEDIDTLWKWGEENKELWSDAINKWYPKESLRRWIEDTRDDVLLVARDDGKLAGMCMVNVLRDWAWCTGLYVDTQYQRMGIGNKLVEQAKSLLLARGVNELAPVVEKENKKAFDFYKKNGFAEGFEFIWMNKSLKGKNDSQ